VVPEPIVTSLRPLWQRASGPSTCRKGYGSTLGAGHDQRSHECLHRRRADPRGSRSACSWPSEASTSWCWKGTRPSTAHLLDELGLLEYVLAQPHSFLEVGKVRLNGKEVGEFRFKKIAPKYPYAIWMPQPVFLDAMLRSRSSTRSSTSRRRRAA
jgi:hypothetical protein